MTTPDPEIAAKDIPVHVHEYHAEVTMTLAGQHAELREFLERNKLGKFSDALLDYGIDSMNDLSDEELLHNSVLKSPLVGMRDREVERLRKAVHEHNGGTLAHSEFVFRSQQTLIRDKSGVNLHDEGSALALLVKDEDYPSGDADCIRANYRAATLSWNELCGEVIESGDTIFHFDTEVCEKLFDVIDDDGSGELTVEEILGAGEKPAVEAYVEESNQPILGHLVRRGSGSKAAGMQVDGIKKAFLKAVDQDGDDAVDKTEWNVFINNLRHQRIVYLKQFMLIKRKCYNGHGMRVGHQFANPFGVVSPLKWVPRGYLEDFWYYACNNHPLLIFFFTDPENPFTPYERRVDFVVTTAVTLLGASLLVLFKKRMVRSMTPEDTPNAQVAASAVGSLVAAAFVSVPVMLTRQTGFYLVGCPCLLRDESTLDEQGQKRYRLLNRAEEYAAHTLVVVALVLVAGAVLVWSLAEEEGEEELGQSYWIFQVALFFPQTWVWWFLQTGVVEFNPSPTVAAFLCTCGHKVRWYRALTFGKIGIGQWHEERKKVLSIVRAKIKERGEEHFMNDGAKKIELAVKQKSTTPVTSDSDGRAVRSRAGDDPLSVV